MSALEEQYERLEVHQRAVAPVIGELVGLRFMRLVGIGTAPDVKLLARDAALALDRREWILKTTDGRNCFHVKRLGELLLAVARIPGAVTLAWLRNRYGVEESYPTSKVSEIIGCELPPTLHGLVGGSEFLTACRKHFDNPKSKLHALDLVRESSLLWLRAVLSEGKEAPPHAEEFYSDFEVPADWTTIRAAIAANSRRPLVLGMHYRSRFEHPGGRRGKVVLDRSRRRRQNKWRRD